MTMPCDGMECARPERTSIRRQVMRRVRGSETRGSRSRGPAHSGPLLRHGARKEGRLSVPDRDVLCRGRPNAVRSTSDSEWRSYRSHASGDAPHGAAVHTHRGDGFIVRGWATYCTVMVPDIAAPCTGQW